MEDKTLITVAGLVCITMLEACALFNGIDGSYFMPIVSAISALAGGIFGIQYEKKKNMEE